MLEGIILFCFLLFVVGITVFLLSKIRFKKRWLMRVVSIGGGLVVVMLVLFSTYTLSKSRTVQLFGNIISKVETDEKVVALTFDDGPTGHYTSEVLELLSQYHVKGTFYLNGSGIDENMTDAKEIINAGHEIGNHTYSHPRLMLMDYTAIKTEFETTDKLIREAGYDGDITIRTPYCKKLLFAPMYFAIEDRLNVTFSVEPQTYCQTANDIVDYVKDTVKSGDIILLHVLNQENKEARKALPEVLEYLTSEGYTLMTVSELLELNDY